MSPLFVIWLSVTLASTEKKLICQTKVEMGTNFRICVWANKDQSLFAQDSISKSFDLIREIDAWMSEWRPETELSRINSAAGSKPIVISKKLFSILKFAKNVASQSQGAFDPTFNALWGLYNFKPGQEREPSAEELNERLPLINYMDLQLENQKAMLKRPAMKLGLGGLGQGYAVDEVATHLKKIGFKNGYVDGSGDSYFFGNNYVNGLERPWTVSIRNPRDHSKNLLTLSGTSMAVTTAGDDEKFFMKGSRRVHHILDPKTGLPVSHTRQVTVIAKTALEADAYDTAFFVLGLKKATVLAKKLKLGFVHVDSDFKVTITKNIQ